MSSKHGDTEPSPFARKETKKMYLPSDPNILLSVINTKLRDEYSSLDDLCDSLDIEKDRLTEDLKSAGYKYNESLNQFV